MRRAAFLLLAAAVFAAPAEAQSIGGHYSVAGTNFDGSHYSGTADITLTSQTTCRIHWQTGGSSSDGICMRNEDSFAAGYVLGDSIGLVVYKEFPDGSLHGLWTIADQEGIGAEVLTPTR